MQVSAADHRRLLAMNIAIDRDKGALPANVQSHFESRLQPDAQTLEEQFEDADADWYASHRCDALCLGPPYDEAVGRETAQVARADTFAIYHVYGQIGPQAKDRLLSELDGAEREDVRALFHGVLRGSRNVSWVTYHDELDNSFEGHELDELPDVACDRLGLIHHGSGVDLLLVRFPENFFEQLRVPTHVDGGTNPAFCSWPAGVGSTGYTWCLASQDRGLPELVAQDRELEPTCRVSNLGATQRSREMDVDRALGRA